MKILMISPYVTLLERPEFRRNKTGFGYMVYDIAKAVGRNEKVDILCTDSRGSLFTDNDVRYLKRSISLFALNIFKCESPLIVFLLWCKYKMPKTTFMRTFYYWMMTGYLRKIIKKEDYDIVHIHGCGFAADLWIKICKRVGKDFVVTLHGLNSFSDTVRLNAAGKKYERDFLQRVVNGEIPITVISTGMKRLIEKTYGIKDCSNINVVCNSFSFKSAGYGKIDVRSLYKIPHKARIVLYVGNISENKNQRQMIESFSLLPDELQETTYILFCGKNEESCHLDSLISKQKHSDHIILCGSIDKTDMQDYYNQADGVALLSYAEGFGLSLIEGMHFGLPCMMFSDMDAFEDLYDDSVVVAINDRRNETVTKALAKLLSGGWDKNIIRKFSNKFDDQAMAKRYVDIYKTIISD